MARNLDRQYKHIYSLFISVKNDHLNDRLLIEPLLNCLHVIHSNYAQWWNISNL